MHEMDFSNVCYTISKVIKESEISQDKKRSLSKSLERINHRIKDPNLYLGIIGEFSSGKSTLINSLIGADFFITNAIQGTTTVITKIAYGESINLILKYKSGKNISYKRHELELLRLFLPEEHADLPYWSKFVMYFKGIFGANRCDRFFHSVFDIVTTSNEISSQLDEVIVYYPSVILKNGLVIVDTPGTDSLIPEHNIITQRAIAEVCDTALVVVPATTPLSMTLVDFLEDNIGENLDKCRFIITKIELLRKEIERLQLVNGVSKRIEQYLSIDEPTVLPAPTLASLEYKGIIETTNILQHLSCDEKEALTSRFEEDLHQMFDKIQANREITICNKIQSLITSLNNELTSEISGLTNNLEKELEKTRLLRVKPLAEFIKDFYSQNKVLQWSYVEARIYNSISQNCEEFKKHVNNIINSAESKDDAQNSMSLQSTIEFGNNRFNDCYADFCQILYEIKDSFETCFVNFRKHFTEMYGIEAMDFSYQLKNNPSWNVQYNFNYSKSNLTTFPLFRYFRSLDSIKRQMIDDVNPKISGIFSMAESSYTKKAKQAYECLAKQMESTKILFGKKYQTVIDRKIIASKKKEKSLQNRIETLNQQMKLINVNL